MKKIKTGAKVSIFLAIVLALLLCVGYVLQPIWTDWNMRNTTYGYYKKPKDTVETLFLGSSASTVGVIPMQLYEDYGIASYNAGTESQPLMASYYLAEEFERRNPDTLDTIVLEVSMLRDTALESMYVKVLDSMRWYSPVKFRFAWDLSEDFSGFLTHLIPALSYHDRLEELSAEDFQKASYDLATYTRGYYFVTGSRLDRVEDESEIPLPNGTVQEDTVSALDEEALSYFADLLSFCDSHDIQLMLYKTPQDDWTDADHNAVEDLAESEGLSFYDFNYEPLLEAIDYNGATDRLDENHMNYYGATELTDWLGRYLAEECDNRDVRGDAAYSFMEEELTDYHRQIISITLDEITDPAEYLSYLAGGSDYAVFISSKEDASVSLTEAQRETFDELGLAKLSDLSSGMAYLAVLDNGRIMERTETLDETVDEADVGENGEASDATDEEEEEDALILEGTLIGGTAYALSSGASVSSIQIEGEEYSRWSRGLNIVVYDKKLNLVVDRAAFDTYASPVRDGN